MTQFTTRLHSAIQEKCTPALVGLDPRADRLPPQIVQAAKQRASTDGGWVATAFEEFCCRIVDVVAPLVPAVKPPGGRLLRPVVHRSVVGERAAGDLRDRFAAPAHTARGRRR